VAGIIRIPGRLQSVQVAAFARNYRPTSSEYAPSVARMIGARSGAADDSSHFHLFKTPLPAPARVALCAWRTKAERLFSSLVFTVADCTGCCRARERPKLAIAGVIQFAKL
jgi:hypothetical protein